MASKHCRHHVLLRQVSTLAQFGTGNDASCDVSEIVAACIVRGIGATFIGVGVDGTDRVEVADRVVVAVDDHASTAINRSAACMLMSTSVSAPVIPVRFTSTRNIAITTAQRWRLHRGASALSGCTSDMMIECVGAG